MAALAGCLDSSADKGLEDDVPTDGKADSFGTPTEHGAVTFGTPSTAAFTDTSGFHSWTFTLTGSAKVKLATRLDTQNLDTVVYLYKKTGSSWGTYIETNDDATSSTATSKIEKQLTKGEYRLIVKTYKRTQRGNFAVESACTGAGCPTADVCADPATLPEDTGYDGTVGNSLARVFETAKIASTASKEISPDERCTLGALERRSVDLYGAYWRDVGADEEIESLSVDTTVLAGATGNGGGTLVDVNNGGDESAISFVYDKSGNLVALYQHNQSPDVRFFGGQGEIPDELPGITDCMGALVSGVQHAASLERTLSLSSAPNNLPVGTGAQVSKAFARYQTVNGTGSTKLTATGAQWEQFGSKAAAFTLSASGQPTTRYLATDEMVLLESTNGSGQLVCE